MAQEHFAGDFRLEKYLFWVQIPSNSLHLYANKVSQILFL